MQGWSNLPKSINVLYYVNKTRDKNHIIISTDAANTIDKIQPYFMVEL